MSRFKGTPGPWHQYKDNPLIICEPGGGSIGEMTAGYPGATEAEMLANAKLVASAFAMLDALETIADEQKIYKGHGDYDIEPLCSAADAQLLARAVLDAATKEETE